MGRSCSSRLLEKGIATASFAVAVLLAFISMFLTDDHDVAANVCICIAQFLTLTATLLGIDYKFSTVKFTNLDLNAEN